MQLSVLDLRDCSEFRQALDARPPRYLHATFALTMALFAAAAAWAAWAELDLIVRAEGRVRSPSSRSHDLGEVSGAKIAARIPGRVARFEALEGAEVTSGAIVAVLEAPRLEREEARLARTLGALRRELALLARLQTKAPQREQLELERLAQAEARREEARVSRLVRRGVRPAIEAERARAARKSAESACRHAALALEVREEELRLRRLTKEGEIEALEAQRAAVASDLAERVVRAPHAGVITRVSARAGEPVQPGQPLAVLARQTDLHIDLRVRGVDVGELTLGLRARVKLDALDHRRYGTASGRVVFVSPDAPLDSPQGASYLVRVALDQSALSAGGVQAPIKLGMTGRVEIATGSERLLVLAWRRLRGVCSE